MSSARRRTSALFGAFLAMMLVPLPGAAQSAAAPPLVTLHLSATPDDDVGPILYAQRAGLLARAGITVVLDKSASGAAAAAAVLSGSYDIAKSSLVNLMSAHEKGVPFTLVAPAGM